MASVLEWFSLRHGAVALVSAWFSLRAREAAVALVSGDALASEPGDPPLPLSVYTPQGVTYGTRPRTCEDDSARSERHVQDDNRFFVRPNLSIALNTQRIRYDPSIDSRFFRPPGPPTCVPLEHLYIQVLGYPAALQGVRRVPSGLSPGCKGASRKKTVYFVRHR